MSKTQSAEAASATIPTDIAETQPPTEVDTAEEASDEISIEIVYHPQKEPLRVPVGQSWLIFLCWSCFFLIQSLSKVTL
jgi:hypothetical protein